MTLRKLRHSKPRDYWTVWDPDTGEELHLPFSKIPYNPDTADNEEYLVSMARLYKADPNAIPDAKDRIIVQAI